MIGEIIIIITFLFLVGAGLYLAFGWFKGLFHDLLLWHKPSLSSPRWFEGYSVHARCKYCGKEIVEDGQGNWFEV